MPKAIKWAKIIAWTGIIVNVILLFIVFVLYQGYQDALWVGIALGSLRPFAFIAKIMMYSGIFLSAILDYKSGVRLTRHHLMFIVAAAVIAVVYRLFY